MSRHAPLVVTRHPALIDYLRETGIIGPDAEVVAHVADPATLRGRIVVGVLPMHLAAEAVEVWEIPLTNLPPELRGAELAIEQVRQYAGPLRRYRVQALQGHGAVPCAWCPRPAHFRGRGDEAACWEHREPVA